ncbi:MAG TPA: heme-binding protein [Longimicrobium sp.]
MSMQLSNDFVFRPIPEIEESTHKASDNPLGDLAQLAGTWGGTGFNLIWRPHFQAQPGAPPQDHFLELNLTNETLQFNAIPGDIPNRGLLQPDLTLAGIQYLQQISDATTRHTNRTALHFEPGMWLNMPPTTNPREQGTVCRLGSIPHGTTVLAQGVSFVVEGPPEFDVANTVPFEIGNPQNPIPFPESNLSEHHHFRFPAGAHPHGITQEMVDNPNSVLQAAIAGQTIIRTVVLQVSSDTTQPLPPQTPPTPPPPPPQTLETEVGGGTANTAFLEGAPPVPQNANANAALVTATFWIETVQGPDGEPDFLQLQYTQTVLLNFNGLSWPHVSVATLRNFNP